MIDINWSRFPILGGLHFSKLEHHMDALVEFSSCLIMSTIPLWMGAILIYVMTKQIDLSYVMAFKEMVKHGELSLYAASISAPIFYIALKNRDGAKSYPNQLGHIILIICLIYIPALGLYALQRAGVWVNPEKVINASWIIFIISLAVFYLALVYNRMLSTNPLGSGSRKDDDYAAMFKKHRGNQCKMHRVNQICH